MKALFEFAIAGANVIPTLLLIFIMFYWLTVLIGAIDMDAFDIDLDMDADVDAGTDLGDGHAEGGLEWLNSLLRFFNLGRIPLMVFLTFLILPLWLFCIIVNDFFGFHGLLPGLLTLVVGFWVCLFVAKVLTMPFVKLFDKLDEDKNYSAIGKICVLKSSIAAGRLGQAEVIRDGGGAPIILTVCAPKGVDLSRGERALVLEHQPDRSCYLVEPFSL